MNTRVSAALIALSAGLSLSACATDGYGYGGYGYGPAYYGSSYYGWYDDYYYPGTGYYVYDRSGGRHAWNNSQRRYWESRRVNQRHAPPNWHGYPGARPPQHNNGWRAPQQQNSGRPPHGAVPSHSQNARPPQHGAGPNHPQNARPPHTTGQGQHQGGGPRNHNTGHGQHPRDGNH